MKNLFILFTAFFATPLWAAMSSETSQRLYDHAVYGNAGFYGGGINIGADYEYRMKPTFGVGGFARVYQKSTDSGVNGLTTLGGFIRPHFYHKSWDLYFNAGLGIQMIDTISNSSDENTLGAHFAIGLIYQMSKKLAFGVERMSHYGWFSSDYRRFLLDELSIKLRFSF